MSKEAILSGQKSSVTEPMTSTLIEELYKQRQSSKSIIDEKNKLISEMARKIGELSGQSPDKTMGES